MLYWS